jgi:hypothetical protein
MAAPPESTTAPNAGGISNAFSPAPVSSRYRSFPRPGSEFWCAFAASGLAKCYAFKNWLQEYAEKVDLPAPEYRTVKEGPVHEPVFRSTVAIDGAKYDSLPGFFTRKAAEQSASEAALMEIVESIPTTWRIPADVRLKIIPLFSIPGCVS